MFLIRESAFLQYFFQLFTFVIGQRYSNIIITEQPSDLTFLNTMQGSINCRSEGHPTPTVTWLTESGSPVTDIPNLRSVQNDRIIFHQFQSSQYNAQIHNAKYRCKVASLAGEILSRLATVRAGELLSPSNPIMIEDERYG